MALEGRTVTLETYLAKFAERGGIVEERITGDEVLSPSCQLRITPLGEVEVLSTHDQILGGPTGQSYLGCSFPAAPQYARTITRQAEAIGARLAELGVLGRFAVDFVVVRRGDLWDSYAIEVNLRKGGTTHPFLTMQFLTGGRYDSSTGLFTTPARPREAPRRHGPPGGREPARPAGRRPLRHRGAHRPALRPRHPDGRRAPHAQLGDRGGSAGPDRGGRHRRRAQECYDRAERILLSEARSAARPDRPGARAERRPRSPPPLTRRSWWSAAVPRRRPAAR